MFEKINVFILPISGLIIGTVLAVVISTSELILSISPQSNLEDQSLLIDKIVNSNTLLELRIEQLEKEHEKLSSLVINPVDREILEQLKNKLSLTQVEGPGVTLKIDLTKNLNSNNESVCFASYLRDLKNVLALQSLGIKGISINGNRLALRSSINCIGNGVVIDFHRVIIPYEIDIVGPQDKITNILNTKKYLSSLWDDIDNGLLDISLTNKDSLVIPPYSGNIHTNYILPYVES